MHDRFAKLYENTKAATIRVASTYDYGTSVVYMCEVFELLSKANVYAQKVRTIPYREALWTHWQTFRMTSTIGQLSCFPDT